MSNQLFNINTLKICSLLYLNTIRAVAGTFQQLLIIFFALFGSLFIMPKITNQLNNNHIDPCKLCIIFSFQQLFFYNIFFIFKFEPTDLPVGAFLSPVGR
jgi:hypothetical protein